jgi:tetratricopeptide (TPR) repeat protein
MGHCLQGYFCLLASTVTMLAAAWQSLSAAEGHVQELTARERTHIAALRAWYTGDVVTACRLWDDILLTAPTDILALRLHHFVTFWMGHPYALRDGVARVFSAWDEQTPGYSYVLGMYAFGLEEAGSYAAAEAYGKQAVRLNPADLWAMHAVAHVLEMQGRLHEGIVWMDYAPHAWAERNAMKSHLWWHLALFSLELGDYDRVLAIYDEAICQEKPAFYIEIQNAASLLLRLEFQGVALAVCEGLGEAARAQEARQHAAYLSAY